ncbi:MAG: protein BatD [Deltaproteobacteria bacterium]|nr:protein BatD [Deltaproteobacteria bacterium]
MARILLLALLLVFASAARADEARLSAQPSSTELTSDENVSIEFKAESEGMGGSISTPRFQAPDFDEINFYSAGTGMESSFINGRITVRHTKTVVAVLHPKREGRLTISNIQVVVNGKPVRAPDIVVEVRAAGAKLGSRQGGGGGGSAGLGYPSPGKLPGGTAHAPNQANAGTFFIRTEPSKLKAYKGEQVILTYALYTRVQIMNIQVERYPNPAGFLKEDIDIPLLRGRLDYAPSVVNGHEYRRAVLAQYAVFPLQEGTLPIDTFTAKLSFQAGIGMPGSDDDPFAMLNNFFRAMQTATETRSSDRVSLEVAPLPGAGQPANFSGLVGDFDITAVADKTSVRAGEPINVKVKVEGKGHAGSLEHLAVAWPQDFELYEDKSNTQYLKSGQSERLFEYMVIPKLKGRYEIPAIELTMFNPDTRAYQVRKSQPIAIEVLEGTGGTSYTPKVSGGAPLAANEDIRYWHEGTSGERSAFWGVVTRALAAVSLVVAALSLWSLGTSPDEERTKSRQRNVQLLRQRVHTLKKSDGAPVDLLGEVESILGQVIELQYGIAIGSLTRAEVSQALVEYAKSDESTAKRVEALLELVEHQRYSPGGGDPASAHRAVDELIRLADRLS